MLNRTKLDVEILTRVKHNQKKAKRAISYVNYLLTPKDQSYRVQTALSILANIPLNLNTAPIWHIFHINHIVTINQAYKWLQHDYKKHPSSKRAYQLIDVHELWLDDACSFLKYFYVKDNSPMSIYKRLKCEMPTYDDVCKIIQMIKHIYIAEINLYKHAIIQDQANNAIPLAKKVFQKKANVPKIKLPF